MIPFLGFLPDADPYMPGVITECSDAIPTTKGMAAAPTLADPGIDAVAATVLGAAALFKLDATSRTFVGTATKLYELSGTSWTDVARVGDYTTGDIRWRFSIMGNTCLATNKNDILQYSNSGDFADVASSPKAEYMDVTGGFVMLAGVDLGGGSGFESDRWICSGFQDYSDWTPDVTTQCTTGRIVDAPGPLRGMKALGSGFVAYKDRAVFIGQYVGAPAVWQWTRVPGDIGCSNHEAVVNIETAHYFVGQENIYAFDGNTIQPVGDGIKEWFFANLNVPYRYKISGLHERSKGRVWWFFPKGSSTTLNAAIVYSYYAKKWGYAEYAVECPLEYITGGVTWDTLQTIASTWDTLPNVAWDSPFWTASIQKPAIIDSTHTLMTLTGVSSGCTIKSGIMGDDTQNSLLARSRPRFTVSPTAGTMVNSYANTYGDTMTIDATATLTNGKFDVLRSAKWHQVEYSFTGDCEITGHNIYMTPDGLE